MSYRDELDDAMNETLEKYRQETYLSTKKMFEGLSLEQKVDKIIEIYAEKEASRAYSR